MKKKHSKDSSFPELNNKLELDKLLDTDYHVKMRKKVSNQSSFQNVQKKYSRRDFTPTLTSLKQNFKSQSSTSLSDKVSLKVMKERISQGIMIPSTPLDFLQITERQQNLSNSRNRLRIDSIGEMFQHKRMDFSKGEKSLKDLA